MEKIIGSDETGVGDYFTPLVVAAVYVNPVNYDDLAQAGVKDSKLLTDHQILKIYALIKPFIKAAIRSMSQAQYNLLTSKMHYNAHELKTLLHINAINSLCAKIEVDKVVIDQYASLANFQKYQTRLAHDGRINDVVKPILLVEKAESQFLTVACASIVARKHLIDLMENQRQTWNFAFPLGASALVITKGKEFVQMHGKSNLYQVAKLSFKTTRAILET